MLKFIKLLKEILNSIMCSPLYRNTLLLRLSISLKLINKMQHIMHINNSLPSLRWIIEFLDHKLSIRLYLITASLATDLNIKIDKIIKKDFKCNYVFYFIKTDTKMQHHIPIYYSFQSLQWIFEFFARKKSVRSKLITAYLFTYLNVKIYNSHKKKF